MYVYTAAPLKEIRFFYNADGLRTRKQRVLGGRVVETTDYILHGKLVTEMRRGSDVLHFFYDAQSRPAMVKYNGQMYTYVHNLQGDIVAIVDSSGAKVVEYRYDAWGRDIGRTLTSDIGELNPFRYRGYVYDEETEVYYLQNRYYDTGKGRFLNADAIIVPGILLCNSFAYCSNNGIRRVDATGHAWYDGIVNAWNSATNFIKECFQAQAQADIISAQQTMHAYNKIASGVKKAWNSLKNNVSSWWENKAKPWLNQAKETAKTLLNNAKEYVRDALQAQQQADILSAQMTYNAARNIGNWISENWKNVVDWAGIVYTGAVFAIKGAAKVGLVTIAPWATVAMTVADVGFWIYSIGDKLEWW